MPPSSTSFVTNQSAAGADIALSINEQKINIAINIPNKKILFLIFIQFKVIMRIHPYHLEYNEE